MSDLQPNHRNQYVPLGSNEYPSYAWFPQGPGEGGVLKPTRHPCWWDVRNIKDLKEGTYLLPPEFQINVLAFMDEVPYSPDEDAAYGKLVEVKDNSIRGKQERYRRGLK